MIDAYAHCGVEKYLPVDVVRAVMDAAGVERAVLCQHLGQFDNSYLDSVVTAEPTRFAAVALVDGMSADWRTQIDATTALGAFRGIRVTDETLAANPSLVHEAAERGFVVVVYAPGGIGHVVEHLQRLLHDVPDAAVEITHLGSPHVQEGAVRSGFELLELASHPGVVVTLSGLPMFCPHPHHELDELIGATLDAFGPRRVLWGSNFPVGGADVSSYRRELDLVLAGRWALDDEAVHLITHENANRVWFGGDAS